MTLDPGKLSFMHNWNHNFTKIFKLLKYEGHVLSSLNVKNSSFKNQKYKFS